MGLLIIRTLAVRVEIAHGIAVYAPLAPGKDAFRLAADGIPRLVLPAGRAAQRGDIL